MTARAWFICSFIRLLGRPGCKGIPYLVSPAGALQASAAQIPSLWGPEAAGTVFVTGCQISEQAPFQLCSHTHSALNVFQNTSNAGCLARYCDHLSCWKLKKGQVRGTMPPTAGRARPGTLQMCSSAPWLPAPAAPGFPRALHVPICSTGQALGMGWPSNAAGWSCQGSALPPLTLEGPFSPTPLTVFRKLTGIQLSFRLQPLFRMWLKLACKVKLISGRNPTGRQTEQAQKTCSLMNRTFEINFLEWCY